VKRELAWVTLAALAMAGAALAQTSNNKNGAKNQAPGGSAEAAQRGKIVFDKKCAVCHYATSEAKKIGPGLKGLNKRGTFSVNGKTVTDESVREWIENGDDLMPPFKDVLSAEDLRDLIQYVRTL
jgi:mono/diheme cytochrome c family protein